jgi:hypothetical protein
MENRIAIDKWGIGKFWVIIKLKTWSRGRKIRDVINIRTRTETWKIFWDPTSLLGDKSKIHTDSKRLSNI